MYPRDVYHLRFDLSRVQSISYSRKLVHYGMIASRTNYSHKMLATLRVFFVYGPERYHLFGKKNVTSRRSKTSRRTAVIHCLTACPAVGLDMLHDLDLAGTPPRWSVEKLTPCRVRATVSSAHRPPHTVRTFRHPRHLPRRGRPSCTIRNNSTFWNNYLEIILHFDICT